MTKFKLTLLASAVGLTMCGMASQAHATAYAFSNIVFTNLSLTGLTASGVTLSNANVATRDSANYPGAAASGFSAGPTNAATASNPLLPLTGGSDVQQATSGPGPFPGENTFGQALTTTFGARGDAVIMGNLLAGQNAGASDVAEGRLATPGSASSTSGTSTGFNVTVSINQATTFTLSFDATDYLTASTTDMGEFASADTSASFTIKGGPAGFTTQTYSPDALNQSVSATGAGQSFTTSNSDPAGGYTYSTTLSAGTYQFSLLSGAQEQVTAPIPTSVPEPITLSLLGSGLVIVGAVGRRRR